MRAFPKPNALRAVHPVCDAAGPASGRCRADRGCRGNRPPRHYRPELRYRTTSRRRSPGRVRRPSRGTRSRCRHRWARCAGDRRAHQSRVIRGAACPAHGCAGLRVRWPAAAVTAPTAGRCSPSPRPYATGRTDRWPGRRTGALTRWWRRHQRPGAARPHPRRPSAPPPASGSSRRRTHRSGPRIPGRRRARAWAPPR